MTSKNRKQLRAIDWSISQRLAYKYCMALADAHAIIFGRPPRNKLPLPTKSITGHSPSAVFIDELCFSPHTNKE